MTEAKLIRRNAVIDAHRSGMTIKEIEKKYGITQATIKTYLRDERVRLAEVKKQEQAKRIAERTEAIKEDIKTGLTPKESAEKENTSHSTVLNTLRAYRTSEVPQDILYRDLTMPAARKGTIRDWMEKQAGSTLNTPDGQALVTAVYPYIVECLRRTAKGYVKVSYTHAELYYMNRRTNTQV